jgi:mono/diheme cytochrome c family protein
MIKDRTNVFVPAHRETKAAAISTLVAALMISISSASQTEAAGDAEHGKDLAQRWCAACHVVSSEQRQASEAAPPFASIAQLPGFNAEKVAFFLLDPHPKMPNMSLTRREASDLAAYIESQGKAK